jgi:hypothetical protein
MSCEEPRVRQVGVFTDCTCHLPGVVRFITPLAVRPAGAPHRLIDLGVVG